MKSGGLLESLNRQKTTSLRLTSQRIHNLRSTASSLTHTLTQEALLLTRLSEAAVTQSRHISETLDEECGRILAKHQEKVSVEIGKLREMDETMEEVSEENEEENRKLGGDFGEFEDELESVKMKQNEVKITLNSEISRLKDEISRISEDFAKEISSQKASLAACDSLTRVSDMEARVTTTTQALTERLINTAQSLDLSLGN